MLKRHISKGTMSKRHIVEASFIFITIFLYIFENPKRKNLLTLPVPSILKQLNEIKNNKFLFLRFFVVPKKGFIKASEPF